MVMCCYLTKIKSAYPNIRDRADHVLKTWKTTQPGILHSVWLSPTVKTCIKLNVECTSLNVITSRRRYSENAESRYEAGTYYCCLHHANQTLALL